MRLNFFSWIACSVVNYIQYIVRFTKYACYFILYRGQGRKVFEWAIPDISWLTYAVVSYSKMPWLSSNPKCSIYLGIFWSFYLSMFILWSLWLNQKYCKIDSSYDRVLFSVIWRCGVRAKSTSQPKVLLAHKFYWDWRLQGCQIV